MFRSFELLFRSLLYDVLLNNNNNNNNNLINISAKWSSTEEINYKETSGSFKDIPKVSIKVRRVS